MTHRSTTDSGPRDLERRLVTYAVTAGAALVAATQDAAAAPIVNPVDLEIPVGVADVPLDVDGDGVADFFFNNVNVDADEGFLAAFGALPANGFLGITKDEDVNLGFALPKGSYQWGPETDGPGVINSGKLGFADADGGGLLLPFLAELEGIPGFPTDRYYQLPLVFDRSGNTHFGFASIKAQFAGPGTLDVHIKDVAWESLPDTEIHIVPEPASLGLLALGAAGLALRRRLTRARTE